MRAGDVIAAIIIAIVVLPIVALQVMERPDRRERASEPTAARNPALDSATRAVVVAESLSYARHGRFAEDARAVRALVTLPASVRLLQVDATDSTWTVRLDAALGGDTRQCRASGRAPSPERGGDAMWFCDSRPGR